MKIVLFTDGKDGVVHTLPGEQPLAEIGELLGGTVQEPLIKLTDKLRLCIVEPDEADPSVMYEYLRQGRGCAVSEGACAVVHMGLDGTLRDVTRDDLTEANILVWPSNEGEG